MTNTFAVAGNVGKDPELRKTQGGNSVTSFSVASKTGKDKTSWFNVTCFGKTADTVAEYVKKGSLVYVSGYVEIEKYDDKYYTKVIANSVNFLGKRPESSDNGQQIQSSAQTDDDDQQIPF